MTRLQVSTSTHIEASPDQIWQVLTDLDSYSAWNPFIQRAQALAPGQRLALTMQFPRGAREELRPRVLVVDGARELRWRMSRWVPGMLESEFVFRLEALGPRSTELVFAVTYSGWLVADRDKLRERQLSQACLLMNEALRREAERPAKLIKLRQKLDSLHSGAPGALASDEPDTESQGPRSATRVQE